MNLQLSISGIKDFPNTQESLPKSTKKDQPAQISIVKGNFYLNTLFTYIKQCPKIVRNS